VNGAWYTPQEIESLTFANIFSSSLTNKRISPFKSAWFFVLETCFLDICRRITPPLLGSTIRTQNCIKFCRDRELWAAIVQNAVSCRAANPVHYFGFKKTNFCARNKIKIYLESVENSLSSGYNNSKYSFPSLLTN